jgi:hypothetical protein
LRRNKAFLKALARGDGDTAERSAMTLPIAADGA